MKENMSSGIFAERSCRVPSKGRQRFTSQSKATEDCEVLLVSGHKKHSEEHHRQPPNTGLHRRSTGSARDNLCINHKLPSPKATVPCTGTYSLWQPPKSNGCVATVSLWFPRLVFIQVFPSAAKHQELIHVTQALVTGFTWTRRGHLLVGHQADVSNLLLFPNFTAVFVSLSCLILQQLLQLLIPTTSRTAQTPRQIPISLPRSPSTASSPGITA